MRQYKRFVLEGILQDMADAHVARQQTALDALNQFADSVGADHVVPRQRVLINPAAGNGQPPVLVMDPAFKFSGTTPAGFAVHDKTGMAVIDTTTLEGQKLAKQLSALPQLPAAPKQIAELIGFTSPSGILVVPSEDGKPKALAMVAERLRDELVLSVPVAPGKDFKAKAGMQEISEGDYLHMRAETQRSLARQAKHHAAP